MSSIRQSIQLSRDCRAENWGSVENSQNAPRCFAQVNSSFNVEQRGSMVWPVIHAVTSNLAISDIYAAKNEKTLRQFKITHILSLLSFANITPVPEGIENLKLDILDYPDENILDEFKITHAFIDAAVKSGGNVLVHCQAGISRSSTTLCAYLMKSQSLSRDKAFAMIKAVRPIVQPNEGFWEQLKVYEECGYEPEKGKPAYDAWLAKFYAWGGTADPGQVKSKL